MWGIIAAGLVAYNVLVFAIPFPKTGAFFLSWGFTLLAICLQVYVVRASFLRDRDGKSRFYGFPIARIGLFYFIAQLAAGLIFMTVNIAVSIPMWLPLAVYIVLLAVAVVSFVAVDTTKDELERQDADLKQNIAFMRSLQSKATTLVGLTQDEGLKKVLEKFSEDLRFSDPVSNESIRDVENDLAACMDELQRAVVDEDCEAALLLEQKAQVILIERNRLCKLNK